MSNEIVFRQPNAVATTGRRESLLGKVFAQKNTSRRIAISANGAFRKMVNGEPVGKAVRGSIDVIIVAALPEVSREFYAKAYDPDGKPTLPDCWSNRGDKPEVTSPNPQAKTCADCPQNVKGSGGGDRRACRFQRRIGVILPNEATGDIYQFKVPSKSLFGKGSGAIHPFESYVKYLQAGNEHPDTVITNIAFNDETNTPTLVFSPTRVLDDDEYAFVQQVQLNNDLDRFTMRTVAQTDGVAALPAPAAKPVVTFSDEPDEDEAPAPKAQVVEDAEFEEEAKPVKRTVKKADVAPEIKKPLADVIDKWGDDEED